jgi:hypothetical protein
VTNAVGSVTSAVAILTVTNVGSLPVIIIPPASTTNFAGTLVTLNVSATGTPNPDYHWLKTWDWRTHLEGHAPSCPTYGKELVKTRALTCRVDRSAFSSACSFMGGDGAQPSKFCFPANSIPWRKKLSGCMIRDSNGTNGFPCKEKWQLSREKIDYRCMNGSEHASLKQAIDLALAGDWEQAHCIVQNQESATAAWIHAVLHKIEGDTWNSKYWYRRALRPFTDMDAQAELQAIKENL